jgi:hypothetical protein
MSWAFKIISDRDQDYASCFFEGCTAEPKQRVVFETVEMQEIGEVANVYGLVRCRCTEDGKGGMRSKFEMAKARSRPRDSTLIDRSIF